jgi:hypothetical protein
MCLVLGLVAPAELAQPLWILLEMAGLVLVGLA